MSNNDIIIDMTKSKMPGWKIVPSISTRDWTSICYGNGLFVAVCTGTNTIITSPTGVNWTERTVPENSNWKSVCFGNGLFVAVGFAGNNRVMTSPDGINWTTRLVTSNNWKSVCFGNGLFVAVAESGTNRIMTSSDGISWVNRGMPGNTGGISICFGDGLFVIVSEYSENVISTSVDGINWTLRLVSSNYRLSSICFGDGVFVAVGNNKVITSPDGINWTDRVAPKDNSWRSICYGAGMFVAVGFGANNIIMRSFNGIDWTSVVAPDKNNWSGICYADGKFIAVANLGATRMMICNLPKLLSLGKQETSDDIEKYIGDPQDATLFKKDISEWTPFSIPSTGVWKSVCYGDNKKLFIAVANSGTNRLMKSKFGIFWTVVTPPENNTWESVCYSPGRVIYVAVASSGTKQIMYSTDGKDWTGVAGGGDLRSVCCPNTVGTANGTVFVAVGTAQALISPDGITWTGYPMPPVTWDSVCYGNGLFVAVSTSGRYSIATSPDGKTWSIRLAPENFAWTSVCYGNGRFVAVSTGTNAIMTSTNGIDWTLITHSATGQWTSVCYGGGLFVAVCTTVTVTSLDGINWNKLTGTTGRAVCYGNDMFISVGNSNLAYMSKYIKAQLPDTIFSKVNKLVTNRSMKNITSTNVEFIRGRAIGPSQILFGNGIFLCIVEVAGIKKAVRSKDGFDWTINDTNAIGGKFCYGGGKFVMLTDTMTSTSVDGINWTTKPITTNGQMKSMCYGNGLFVAVGNIRVTVDGVGTVYVCIMTSSDGLNWTIKNLPNTVFPASICYGNGTFVTLGTVPGSNSSGAGLISRDAVTWTEINVPINTPFETVFYINGLFIANGGALWVSDDGVSWRTLGEHAAGKSALCYGNGLYMGIAVNLVYSENLMDWYGIYITAPVSNVSSVCYGNGVFVALSVGYEDLNDAGEAVDRVYTCVFSVIEHTPSILSNINTQISKISSLIDDISIKVKTIK